MTFSKRVRLYLFGVLLGMVLVTFLFRDRVEELSTDKAITEVRRMTIIQDSLARCWLDCYGYTPARLDSILAKGRVVFDGSETAGKGSGKYRVRTQWRGDTILMTDLLRVDSTSLRLLSIRPLNEDHTRALCDCE